VGGDRGDLADAVVERVGDEQVPLGVHRGACWTAERGGHTLTAVAGITARPGAGNCGDHTGRADLSNHVGAVVPDEEVAGNVEHQTDRVVELGGGGLAAIPGSTGGPGAGHRHDFAGGDPPHPVVARVGHVDRPAADRQPGRRVQLRRGGEAAVSCVTGHPRPGERGDGARWRYLADDVIGVITDEEVAGRVERELYGPGQLGGRRGPAVSCVTGDPSTGDGGDGPSRVDLADAGVPVVGDVEVAGRVGDDGGRQVQPC
jgi:hypothetical protein